MASQRTLGPGDRAPDFQLRDIEGGTVSLPDLLGPGPLVLFFVPHPPRGICKRTECRLRDEDAELKARGARVVGVTPMGRRAIGRAVAENGLTFPLLSDRDRSAHDAYAVPKWRLLLPGRATFVIDPDGIVRWVTRDPINANRHAGGAVAAVRRITS